MELTHTTKPLVDFLPGDYRFIPGGFQYSAAVIAKPGYVIERVRLHDLPSLSAGFAFIRQHLQSIGRPLTALCACELRSPAAVNEAEFVTFNRHYVTTLAEWGLFNDETNPVARCNLIPLLDPPTVPSLYAFCYTVPCDNSGTPPDFVTSGAAECPDQPNYRQYIVRLGDTSPTALEEKIRFAIGDLQSRFHTMNVQWQDVSDMHLYSTHNLFHTIVPELLARGALASGLRWHWASPPIIDIEIEIDARRVSRQWLKTL